MRAYVSKMQRASSIVLHQALGLLQIRTGLCSSMKSSKKVLVFPRSVHGTSTHGSPVAHMSSPPCASKAQARRLACFRMCPKALDRGLLEYDQFPQPSQSAIRRRRAPDVSIGLDPDDVLGVSALQPKGSSQNKLNGPVVPTKKTRVLANALVDQTSHLYPAIFLPENSATSSEMLRSNAVTNAGCLFLAAAS